MAEFEFFYKSVTGIDALFIDGPVIEVQLTAPHPAVSYLADNDLPPYAVAFGMAVIDTGAAVSVVEASAMTALEIPFIDSLPMQTAHGVADMPRYNLSASFPGLNLQYVPLILAPAGFIRTSTEAGSDIIMLLGRDLLRRMVVTYDGRLSKVTVKT